MVFLNSFLCWKLQTGALVIGWLYLICGIVGIFGAILFGFFGELVVDLGMAEQPNNDELRDRHMKVVRSIEFTTMGFEFLNLITAILLLCGIYKNRRFMLIPWLVISFINSLIIAIGVSGLFVFYAYNSELIGAISTLILAIGLTSLLVYVWLCVYSLYQKMNLDDKKRVQSNDEVQFIASAPIAENTMPLYPPLYEE